MADGIFENKIGYNKCIHGIGGRGGWKLAQQKSAHQIQSMSSKLHILKFEL